MQIGVVTDSSSDLPLSVFERTDVISVPLDVRLGDRKPEELRELSGDEFWSLVQQGNDLPTTAAPSPGAFIAAFNKLHESGCEQVICITLSSELSATNQSALLGAAQCEFPVSVIDSRNATMGQGLLVLEAVAARDHLQQINALTEYLLMARDRITTFGTLDTLENLHRGGRIGGAQAFLGTLLSIKPIIVVRDGRVEAESKQRTRARSFNYLAEKVRAAAPLERLAVVHARASDVMDFIRLLEGIKVTEELIISTMGPVIGAHTGLGTVGVAFLQQEVETQA